MIGNIIGQDIWSYVSRDELTAPTIPSTGIVRAEYVAGGYKIIGNKCYVDLIVKVLFDMTTTVITASGNAGTYSSFIQVPKPKTITPLEILYYTESTQFAYGICGVHQYWEIQTVGEIVWGTFRGINASDNIYAHICGVYEVA